MKKLLLSTTMFSLLGTLFLLGGCSSSNSNSKEVSVCTTYIFASEAELECDGSAKGKTTLKEMYKNSWKLEESVAGGYKFILVFAK